jgi:hypothetical protein
VRGKAIFNLHGKFALILFLTAFLTVFACSDDTSQKDIAKTSGRRITHEETPLRLVIRWPGDDFASRQDIETQNRIRTLIAERKVGTIISAATGMGWMDIVVKVKDKQAARSSISKIMRIAAPTRKFTIE